MRCTRGLKKILTYKNNSSKVNIQMVQLLFDTADENGLDIDLDSQDFWGNSVLHMLANAPAKPLKYVSL